MAELVPPLQRTQVQFLVGGTNTLCAKKRKDRNTVLYTGHHKILCKVHVLIFEILQDAFTFLLSC